jgi:hypothetical protein
VFAAFRALGGRTYLARHHVASERLHAPRSHDLAP